MASMPRIRTFHPAWRFALIGAVASLPIAAIMNWLPNSEATVGGSIMVLGAFIAGVTAAARSADPDAAGLRAGFLGGVLGVVTFIATVVGTTAAWPLSRVVFFVFANGLVLCIAPIFGLGCGRVGGWVAGIVASRWKTSVSPS